MTCRAVAALLLLYLAAAAGQKGGAGPHGMLELTDESFVAALSELPDDRWVLLEFYAHWCPHCQRFKPEYEKVAAYFHDRGEQEPVITVARLDCADHIGRCSKFEVRGYPTIKVGLASDFAAVALDKLTDATIKTRNAAGVVEFVASHLNVKLSTDSLASDDGGSGAVAAATVGGRKGGAGLVAGAKGEALVQHAHVMDASGAKVAVPLRADLVDMEGATIKSWQYLTASPQLLKGPEARQALKDWVDLLADYHPVDRCREGAEKLQEALDETWPDDADLPEESLQKLQICPGSRFKEWQSCRGTRPDSRGFTCGLWQLFHTLASRLPETENAGAVWLAAIKGFVKNYFQCTECAKHFVKHASAEGAISVARKRDAVLWMWHTHNIVNRRLAAEDKAEPSKADPASPHLQFPPAALCSKCRKAEGQGGNKDEAVPWDEEKVYRFLLDYYSGEQLKAALSGSGGGGGGKQHTSWGDAGLVLGSVAVCVVGVLQKSGQYSLRKSSSRSL